MTIRVLVVDDSAMMRALISRKLNAEDDIEVIGCAHDAMDARQRIKQLNPDVVTLDIEMPGMDGLSFLEKIMTLRPTPVIVVSGSTRAGTQATARALQLGAVNCYAKSTRERSIKDDDGGELARLVREASKIDMTNVAPSKRPAGPTTAPPDTHARTRPDLIAIGSSTGGVEALNKLLCNFPADCPPTLIVQHVNATFAPAIAQTLDKIAAPRVELAQTDTILRPGLVLLAPGELKHLEVATAGSQGYRAVLRDGDLVSGHRPSVDRLFASAAKHVGERALGVILTGMGEDGARGLLAMVKTGAHTIAQGQESCVVFGMPRAAIALGAAKSVVPLDHIANDLFPSQSQNNPSRSAPLSAFGAPTGAKSAGMAS